MLLQRGSCDAKSVVLREVHADMSGYYTCEVTTQVIYETVQQKQYLLVVRKWNISIISIYTYLSKYLNSKTSTGSYSLSLILATSVSYPLNSVTIFNISVQHKT